MWACLIEAGFDSMRSPCKAPEVRGQANYFLVERCLLFDSPIPKVAGVLRVPLGVWGVR